MVLIRAVLSLLLVFATTASQLPTCTIAGCNCSDSVDVVMDECTQVAICGDQFFLTLYSETMVGDFGNDSKCTFGDGSLYNATCGNAPAGMPDISISNCSYPDEPTHVPSTPVPIPPVTDVPSPSPQSEVTCEVTSCDCSDSYFITSDSCGEFTFCNETYNLMLLGEEQMSLFADSRCAVGEQVWQPSCSVNVSGLPMLNISHCVVGPETAVPVTMVPTPVTKAPIPTTNAPDTASPHHRDDSSDNSGSVAGIIAGSIAGALAVAAGIYYCRRRKRPEMREGASRHLFEETIDPNGEEVVN